MQDDEIAIFRQIVMAAHELPAWVRTHVDSAHGVRKLVLDKNYIEFLDEQIALAPRGPEWTKMLQKRREALLNYCGKTLMDGLIFEGQKQCFIKIEPESNSILYWEIW